LVARIGGDDQMVVEEGFHMYVFLLGQRSHNSRQHKIVLAIAQFRQLYRGGWHIVDVQRALRIVLGKAPDDRRKYRGQKRLLAADPQVTDLRVGKVFDIPPALLQLIERRDASPVQRGTVYRWLTPPGAAIEKPHAVTLFEVGDRFGHGGLGNAELLGRF